MYCAVFCLLAVFLARHCWLLLGEWSNVVRCLPLPGLLLAQLIFPTVFCCNRGRLPARAGPN